MVQSKQNNCICTSQTYNVSEVESWMRCAQVFEQTEQLHAVERAPWTMQVVSRLCLLPCVVVVHKLVKDTKLPGRCKRHIALSIKTQFFGNWNEKIAWICWIEVLSILAKRHKLFAPSSLKEPTLDNRTKPKACLAPYHGFHWSGFGYAMLPSQEPVNRPVLGSAFCSIAS